MQQFRKETTILQITWEQKTTAKLNFTVQPESAQAAEIPKQWQNKLMWMQRIRTCCSHNAAKSSNTLSIHRDMRICTWLQLIIQLKSC